MLGSHETTAYDLRFNLLYVPVRVSPWFWLIMAIISGQDDLKGVGLFVACAFASILVHEFGHGLSSRALGLEPTQIVLHGMGGYCEYSGWHRDRVRRILVSLSGVAAGFAFLGIVLAVSASVYGARPADLMAVIGIGPGNPVPALNRIGYFLGSPAGIAILFLMEINFWWGVLNLLPIWPLDGGRVAETGLEWVNPVQATRWAHMASIGVAAAVALWLVQHGQPRTAVWLAYFAYLNFQALQSTNRFSR